VAEYAPNGSLRDRIKKRAPHLLPFQEVLTMLSQIGEALHYAHQQQVIHRDLKPENILFNAINEALLADFGLATSLSTASIKHVDSSGTPRYMAPEQFNGDVSKESDQYGLACIAYELVTGRPPFIEKDFYAIGFKHMAENPILPTQLNPYLPVTIEQVILKAMAKQRADRYPDIASFISALLQSTGSLPAILASSEMELPTLPAVHSKGSSSSDAKPKTPLGADRGSHVIMDADAIVLERNQAIHEAETYNETPEYRNRDLRTPLPPVQATGPVTPLPATPFQDVSTGQTLESPQPRIRSNTPVRANARNVQNNTAFLPVSNWEGRSRRPAISAASGYRWAFMVVLCLAVGAGIMAVLFLGIPPFFSSHSDNNSPGSSQQGPGAVLSTTTPGKPSQHPTPIVKPTHQPASGSSGQITPQTTVQPTVQPTIQPTIQPTPTPPPPPPPTPTPTSTPPPTTDSLTVDFTNPNSVYTAHSYTGRVTVTVSNVGGVAILGWSDAFYEYVDFSGNPINPPQHTLCWVMYIDGQQSDLYVTTPAYKPSHVYQFTMIAPGGPLGFSVCDHTRSDDHGSLYVTVTGNGSSLSPSGISPTGQVPLETISTDMLADFRSLL
jgi:serine/threonine protein kinase